MRCFGSIHSRVGNCFRTCGSRRFRASGARTYRWDRQRPPTVPYSLLSPVTGRRSGRSAHSMREAGEAARAASGIPRSDHVAVCCGGHDGFDKTASHGHVDYSRLCACSASGVPCFGPAAILVLKSGAGLSDLQNFREIEHNFWMSEGVALNLRSAWGLWLIHKARRGHLPRRNTRIGGKSRGNAPILPRFRGGWPR